MPRTLLPIALFAVAGVFGWWVVFSEPRAGRTVHEDDAEPELDAPEVTLAPTRPVSAARPTPPPASPATEKAPMPEPDPPKDEPPSQQPHEPNEPNEPPDPRVVLELPEYLQEKTESEKREYFVSLRSHHVGMLAFARERMRTLLDSEDPDEREEGFRLRRDIDSSEDQLELIEDYLAKHPE